MPTLCNNCKSHIKYISTRKEGDLKCNPLPVKGITVSGRILEVYLEHDCNDRASNKVSGKEDEERELWAGPDIISRRGDNRSDRKE